MSITLMTVPTWRPEGGHRGEQQITDAVTVHASTKPGTKQKREKALTFTNEKQRILQRCICLSQFQLASMFIAFITPSQSRREYILLKLKVLHKGLKAQHEFKMIL